MYEQEAVFLINNKNLTSFGNQKIVTCCMELPVMGLPPLRKQISLVQNTMMVVVLFNIKKVVSTGIRNHIAVAPTDQYVLKFPIGLIFFSYSCCSRLVHRTPLKRSVSLQFDNLRQSVGFRGRGNSPQQDSHLKQTQNKQTLIP